MVKGEVLQPGTESTSNWYKNLSVVTQDSPMFKRSIKENLTYGYESAQQETLQDAIKKSHLETWLSTLEDGLETVLEIREKQLSGGQRQRVQVSCYLYVIQREVF